MCPKLYRLMNRAQWSTPTLNITTTPTQFFGADPLRLRVFIGPFSSPTLSLRFGPTPTSGLFVFLPANGPFQCLRLEEMGQLIYQPIWISASSIQSGAQNITVVSALPQDLVEFSGDY
jgi:hypothetical protein